jgi:LAO/AO transport system kinase
VTAVRGLADRVRRGEPRALARAITLVENETAEGRALVGELYAAGAAAIVIGVTGPPGAGKSTLVDGLIVQARRAGRSVGVLAIDPSSIFTGGAVLGDRIRMGAHAGDPGVFIRSMATRGQLGGLSSAASDAAVLLAAAGREVVIVETVGVGQDEVDVADTADVTVVVLVPGTGDEVQAIKAGIMEIADIFVVNKADREGADRLVQAVEMALSLHAAPAGEEHPPVLRTVATDGTGVDALWAAILSSAQSDRPGGETRQRRRQERRLRRLVTDTVRRRLEVAIGKTELDTMVARMLAREIDPHAAADALVEIGLRRTASLGVAPAERRTHGE